MNMRLFFLLLLAIGGYFIYSGLDYLYQRMIYLSARDIYLWFINNPNMLVQYLIVGAVIAWIFGQTTGKRFILKDMRIVMYILLVLAWPFAVLIFPLTKLLFHYFGKGHWH